MDIPSISTSIKTYTYIFVNLDFSERLCYHAKDLWSDRII